MERPTSPYLQQRLRSEAEARRALKLDAGDLHDDVLSRMRRDLDATIAHVDDALATNDLVGIDSNNVSGMAEALHAAHQHLERLEANAREALHRADDARPSAGTVAGADLRWHHGRVL